MKKDKDGKYKIEDIRGVISDTELQEVGETYANFYKYRGFRSGLAKQYQNNSFEDALKISRELFWNSMTTQSEDLQNLQLDFSVPFARKEVLEFLGRMTSLKVKPRISGDGLDSLGIKALQSLYNHWRFKSNGKVERFWELLYGLVNGTVCSYVGYNNTKLQRRYLKSYDGQTGAYSLETKDQVYWDDVWKEIIPIEDIYLPKIYERNFQKQGRMIWRTQMEVADFHAEFDRKYENAKYVMPGNMISGDSLYIELLGGMGTSSFNKIEVLREYDWLTDKYKFTANGILLNHLGKGRKIDVAPMPFDHKMGPFTWGIMSPLDEKLSYGLMMPFLIKDPHKISNTAITMMVERELRAIDPPIITSDIESPEIIFGQHKVIPVNDVNAYKELNISEPSSQFFTMLNSLQSQMSSISQGGDSQIVPSRQPKSAREASQNAQVKQQSMANAMTMYYDIIRQEVLLVIKTALQFYTVEKAKNGDKRIVKSITSQDMPLTTGGIGNVKLRFVKEKADAMDLFLEAIKESVINGKPTEIIEVPLEFIQDLECYISDIELEADEGSELEMANFVENVINPMLNVYVPAGVADMGKTFLRHVEKMGENPADFASEQALNQMNGQPQKQQQAQSGAVQAGGGQQGVGAAQGNMLQSLKGMKFGGQNNRGLPVN